MAEQKLKVKLESMRKEIKVKVSENKSVRVSIFNATIVLRLFSKAGDQIVVRIHYKVHAFTFFGMLVKQN